MDQLVCASLSQTHYYWYEVGMLKVPAGGMYIHDAFSYEDFFSEIIRVGGVKRNP